MWPAWREKGGGRREGGREGVKGRGKGSEGRGGREGRDNLLLCVRISNHTYLCSCGDHSGVAALENLS